MWINKSSSDKNRNMILLNTSVACTHNDRTNGKTAGKLKESLKDKDCLVCGSELINRQVSVFLSTFCARPFQWSYSGPSSSLSLDLPTHLIV